MVHTHHDDHHHHHHHHLTVSLVLRQVFFLNLIFFLVELIGGYLTGSLALLSDAAHMFTDVAALGLSIFARWVMHKKSDASKTYGYHRAEILAAFVNSITLWLAVGWICLEAFHRIASPHNIHSQGMLIVATLGFFINVVSAALLHRHAHHDLNLKSSYLHLLTDALSSLATIAASLIIWFTGRTMADPIASFLIAAMTLYSSWGLLHETVDVLMEGVPRGIELEAVRSTIMSISGVRNVHDLHVWSLGSRKLALSAHVLVDPTAKNQDLLLKLQTVVLEKYHITHTTLQLENESSFQKNHCAACEG